MSRLKPLLNQMYLFCIRGSGDRLRFWEGTLAAPVMFYSSRFHLDSAWAYDSNSPLILRNRVESKVLRLLKGLSLQI